MHTCLKSAAEIFFDAIKGIRVFFDCFVLRLPC